MSKNEALDSVKDEWPFAGLHILAAAMMCAKGSSPDELALARRLLGQNPRRLPPRERESIAGTFNRQMDTPIDAADESAGCPTRAERRFKIAQALDKAGLVILDRAQLVDLLDRGAPPVVVEAEEESLGAELLATAEADGISIEGLTFGGDVDHGVEDLAYATLANSGTIDVGFEISAIASATSSSGAYGAGGSTGEWSVVGDPNVND
jgi:hypothetical protein